MDDREWLAPEVLAVLDNAHKAHHMSTCHCVLCEATRSFAGRPGPGRPLLSPRARAILEAVGAAMSECDRCCPVVSDCVIGADSCDLALERLQAIRRAYLGTEEARTSLEAAVLAYARPIVAEECAQIVEQSDVASDGPVAKIFNNRLGIIADAIREHGKENK